MVIGGGRKKRRSLISFWSEIRCNMPDDTPDRRNRIVAAISGIIHVYGEGAAREAIRNFGIRYAPLEEGRAA